MKSHMCLTCGTQFTESEAPPPACPVCEDARQFVPAEGQQWTDLEALAAGHEVAWNDEGDGLRSLTIEPRFAIGQRAFLVPTPAGNILWDCIPLIDAATIERVRAAGGLHAIAISHPHFYSSMVEWSRAFGDVPVYLHANDARWVMRPDPAIRSWSGNSLEIAPGARLVCTGGHFAGGTVMQCEATGTRPAMLFSGDMLQVVMDRRHVSFMYSYPNLIPLDASSVRAIESALAGLDFERIHGAFPGRTIREDGRAAFARSLARYLRAISAPPAG